MVGVSVRRVELRRTCGGAVRRRPLFVAVARSCSMASGISWVKQRVAASRARDREVALLAVRAPCLFKIKSETPSSRRPPVEGVCATPRNFQAIEMPDGLFGATVQSESSGATHRGGRAPITQVMEQPDAFGCIAIAVLLSSKSQLPVLEETQATGVEERRCRGHLPPRFVLFGADRRQRPPALRVRSSSGALSDTRGGGALRRLARAVLPDAVPRRARPPAAHGLAIRQRMTPPPRPAPRSAAARARALPCLVAPTPRVALASSCRAAAAAAHSARRRRGTRRRPTR